MKHSGDPLSPQKDAAEIPALVGTPGKTGFAPDPTVLEAERLMGKTMLYGLSTGLIAILCFCLPQKLSTGVYLFGVWLLLSLAAFISGFFTGTLFGMPKRNAADSGDYTLNNSLVEISEWLTKIIVGLGLVNLKSVPHYLYRVGAFVKTATGVKGNSIDVFTICAILYFSFLGVYVGYNYMRLVLSAKYKDADNNMLRQQLKEAKEEAGKMEEQAGKMKDLAKEKQEQSQKILEEINKPAIPVENVGDVSRALAERTDVAEPESEIKSYLDKMVGDARKRLEVGSKETPEDAQKGQWGGQSERNGRRLSAEVVEVSEGAYTIHVKVASVSEEAPLKSGEVVLLALHPTFGNPPFRLATVENGVASVKLYAYGSFTIGAFADRGNTELELDLSKLPNVSEYFKTH